MTISTIIKNELDGYKRQPVEIVDGFFYNQYNTINRIYLYMNDSFAGPVPEGSVFWNLGIDRSRTVATNIDLDTKDLQTFGQGEVNFYQNWILRMKMKRWLKDSKMALTLNELSSGTAAFGSSVWKKVVKDGKTTIVQADLRNLAFDTTVKNINDSDFIIETHYLTELQMRAKKDVWNDVERAIEVAQKANNHDRDNRTKQAEGTEVQKLEVFERYGEIEVPKGKDYEWKEMHQFVAGEGDEEVILFEEEVDKDDQIYFDFHLGQYEGRWLRRGTYETLFKLQERINTLVNQNAMTTEIASMLLLRTDSPSTKGNVLQALESGDIINSPDLTQIVLDNRGLAAFLQEVALIERQADKLVGSTGPIGGEAMPSGTPFRSLAVTTNEAKSKYRYIKDDIGTRVRDVLVDHILPGEIKQWNKGEIFDIMEDPADIEAFRRAKMNDIKWKRLGEFFRKTGNLPTQLQMKDLEARLLTELESDKENKLVIEPNFFDFKFGIEMNVTGESTNKAQQNDAYFNSIQMIQANPAIVNNPLFRQYLENNGISPIKLTSLEMQQIAQPAGGQSTGGQPIGTQEDSLTAQVDTE